MTNVSAPPPEATLQAVQDLLLDDDNPRWAGTLSGWSQPALLRAHHRRGDLGDLLRSLHRQGFCPAEPLLGVRTDAGIVIVDGNRRLAALQTLVSAEKAWSVSDIYPADRLPAADPADAARLGRVPVLLYRDRRDIAGNRMRHMRGGRQWTIFAKARQAHADLHAGDSPTDLARAGGVKRTTVWKWLTALYLLEQGNAASDAEWTEAAHGQGFASLCSILGHRSVREHLGLAHPDPDNPQPPPRNPVPAACVPNLPGFMEDLFGPAPGDALQSKAGTSRDRERLAEVYASPEALARMRAGDSLDDAHAAVAGEAAALKHTVQEGIEHLERALRIAHHYRGRADLTALAERAAADADELRQRLQAQ